MQIKITTNVLIPEKSPRITHLEIEPGETLRGALLKLHKGTDLRTMVVRNNKDEIVAIDKMWEVRVNGRACYRFPEDLDITLGPGDTITLWLTPLGGG